MPKKLKQTTLTSLKTSGAFTLVDVSQWRPQQLLLPRLTDVSSLSPIEFEARLTAISAASPRR